MPLTGGMTETPPPGLDRNGLVVLNRAQCLELLSRVTFGRVAVTIDALPVILPVNFRLVDERIVFHTGPGSKLDAATVGAVVAFEVDGVDPVSHSGWSVIVTGVARELTDRDDIHALERAHVPRWLPHAETQRTVVIPIAMVSGRLLVAGMPWKDEPVSISAEAGAIRISSRVVCG